MTMHSKRPKKSSVPMRKGHKRGPKPQMLKIEAKWEDAVTKSFRKKKPSGGWPK
jgi:hypothetical protein